MKQKKHRSGPIALPEKPAIKGSFLKETAKVFAMALVIAIVLKMFIVDSRVVPSSSMYPTIEEQDRIVLNKLAYVGDRAPQRGDIVVFKAPEELDSPYDLVKRVIGLPGEMLEVKDGAVYIDGEALQEGYVFEAPGYAYGPVTVPENCYFMMGDNRNHSLDSHYWEEPFVPEQEIKGKVVLRYWPFSSFGVLE
ncbi:MAG: signal peptidase I [Firmicutes bacterium]|nr:signal peptidase I [Bacillota bacterium]